MIMFVSVLLAVNSFKEVPLEREFSFEDAPEFQNIFIYDGSMTVCIKPVSINLIKIMTEDITEKKRPHYF